jgi:hypothetical protein
MWPAVPRASHDLGPSVVRQSSMRRLSRAWCGPRNRAAAPCRRPAEARRQGLPQLVVRPTSHAGGPSGPATAGRPPRAPKTNQPGSGSSAGGKSTAPRPEEYGHAPLTWGHPALLTHSGTQRRELRRGPTSRTTAVAVSPVLGAGIRHQAAACDLSSSPGWRRSSASAGRDPSPRRLPIPRLWNPLSLLKRTRRRASCPEPQWSCSGWSGPCRTGRRPGPAGRAYPASGSAGTDSPPAPRHDGPRRW